jgi:hypothetical protein
MVCLTLTLRANAAHLYATALESKGTPPQSLPQKLPQ